MGITDRIYEALGLVTKDDFNARLTEARQSAYYAGYQDGNDDPGTSQFKPGGQGYRVAGRMLRDFSKLSYDKIIEAVWSVYQSNPVAKRVLALMVAYVVGRGITYEVEDDGLREILDSFWEVNRLKHRIKQFVLQLGLWGEQVYPAFVRRADGLTRLGYIDPGQILEIKCHPDNAMEKWAVVLKKGQGATREMVYRVIREQEPVVQDGRVVDAENVGRLVLAEQATLEPWEQVWLAGLGLQQYTGSCFLFQVNNVSNQSRGFSDLLQVLDWLDQLDMTLFEIGEKEQFAGYFSWDVTLEGISPQEVIKRTNEIRAMPPKKGAVNAHNEKEIWELKKPDLRQTESIAVVRTQLTFILGGLGIPEHWYANGDAANRATAAEQGDPSWKSLEDRQSYVTEMLTMMLNFQRDQAVIAGAWSGDDEAGEIEVVAPEMTSKDTSKNATALTQLTSALTVAEQTGWVSHEKAAQIWAKVAAEFGVEIDVREELEKAEEEKPEEPEPSPMNLMAGDEEDMPAEDEPAEDELQPERQGRNGTQRPN